MIEIIFNRRVHLSVVLYCALLSELLESVHAHPAEHQQTRSKAEIFYNWDSTS